VFDGNYENNNAVIEINMPRHTYVSCELVSQPGEYTQRTRQHHVEDQTLRYVRVVTQTLQIETLFT
jgi:hypothetical protein